MKIFIFGIIALSLFIGCAEKIGIQPIDENDWFRQEMRSSLTSSMPSEFTMRFLRKQDLMEAYKKDPVSVLISLEHDVERSPDRETLFALMELCYAEAKKIDPETKEYSKFYLSCMRHAYSYLFKQGLKPALNTYSPRFRWACDFYNWSLAKNMIYRKEQPTRVEKGSMLPLLEQELYYDGIKSYLSWSPQELDQYEVTYEYRMTGLLNHYRSSGIGVPLILVRNLPKHRDRETNEQFLPTQHQFCAGTAVVHFEETPGDGNEPRPKIKAYLSIYDPGQTSKIQINNKSVPLEMDFTTPIAYFLDRIPSLKGTEGFFEPESWTDVSGLYMSSPYQPEKIPVVFVHGLFTNTRTWSAMFNELAGDPLLRERYQAWFFLYPTGNPIMFSATLLRNSLKEVREALDPSGKDAAFDRMVIIGHSMGGLLTKMVVQDSGNIVWDTVFDKPLDALNIKDDERALLEDLLFFKPLPFVKRVIFMATPHRGSELTQKKLAQVGLNWVKLPGKIVDFAKDVTPLIREEYKTQSNYPKKRVPTGFHDLRPDSLVSQTIAGLPIDPKVTYHSIIGNSASASIPGGSDGVVVYKSAHLDGAVSEKIIKSDHNVHTRPAGIFEVRRILHEHLRTVVNKE